MSVISTRHRSQPLDGRTPLLGAIDEFPQFPQAIRQSALPAATAKPWWPKHWSPPGVFTIVILSEAKDLIAACHWHEIPSATLRAGLRCAQDDREENAHVADPLVVKVGRHTRSVGRTP
jgi:hypothetical protein